MTPEEAMTQVLAAVDDYVLHYDEPGRGGIDARAAVWDAIVALVVGELEGRPCPAGHADICGRAAEWRAARSECTCQSASMKVCPTHGLGTDAWSAR